MRTTICKFGTGAGGLLPEAGVIWGDIRTANKTKQDSEMDPRCLSGCLSALNDRVKMTGWEASVMHQRQRWTHRGRQRARR